MHVGVFLDDFKPEAGGGYTFVKDVAEAFFAIAGESRHRFTVFCTPEAAQQLKRRALPANIQLVGLKPRNFFGRIISALKHLSPLFSVLWRWPSALERAAKNARVELLWFVGGFFDTPDMPYIATVWDAQHLTHPWFSEVSAKGRWEYREAFMRRHLKRAMRIITGTQTGKDELVQFYGLPEHRLCILPHPTPAFALQPRSTADAIKHFGLREGFLLYPAQFWAHKNHANLLLALDVLRKRGEAVPQLALVGSDKGNKDYILTFAARLGLADHVRALGFVSVEELTALYQSAGAMVYTSLSGPENLPPLEAFALRCPVAISNYSGSLEQLGDAAIYFDPHDPETIADAIVEILRDSSGKHRRVEQGFKRAQSWTGTDYVRGVFTLIDGCESERRCW